MVHLDLLVYIIVLAESPALLYRQIASTMICINSYLCKRSLVAAKQVPHRFRASIVNGCHPLGVSDMVFERPEYIHTIN